MKYLKKKKNSLHLDHFRGWRIRAEVRGRYQFVGGACPQPQQYPPMLLSSDRLGLHRDEDRPVLSVPSDQVHVLLQKKIRSIRVGWKRAGPTFLRPIRCLALRPSGERRNIFERVRAKGRTIDSSSPPFSCEKRFERTRMGIRMNDKAEVGTVFWLYTSWEFSTNFLARNRVRFWVISERNSWKNFVCDQSGNQVSVGRKYIFKKKVRVTTI